MRACKECRYFEDESEFGVNRGRFLRSSCNVCRKLWRKTPEGRAARLREYHAIKTTPDGIARRALRQAVRSGRVQRPEVCDNGHPGPIEGHHHRGYAPEFHLDVVWLCKDCHDKIHGRKSRGASCAS